jgi:hypothetical protein
MGLVEVFPRRFLALGPAPGPGRSSLLSDRLGGKQSFEEVGMEAD